MNLQDRIERWRSGPGSEVLRKNAANGDEEAGMILDAVTMCAAELEADLRELMEIAERVPHSPLCTAGKPTGWIGVSGNDVTPCPRCALEARIGGAK